jgi:hypothetical protein
MTERTLPEWFQLQEQMTPLIFERMSHALSNADLPIEVRHEPLQAFWHLSNVLYVANVANREGMHATALSLTRQCVECISVIELGLCNHPEAVGLLSRWHADKIKPGDLRIWLERNVWPQYGVGLWAESWSEYMAALARSLQPYSHYAAPLSQWYGRLHHFGPSEQGEGYRGVIELAPRTYDSQKATRITLYHGLLTFTLGRILASSTFSSGDTEFQDMVELMRLALGKSEYLDGEGSKWEQQFWAMLWFPNGDPE